MWSCGKRHAGARALTDDVVGEVARHGGLLAPRERHVAAHQAHGQRARGGRRLRAVLVHVRDVLRQLQIFFAVT